MRIQVNGQSREVTDALSVQELIAELDLPGDRLAIELNRSVVRRVNWSTTTVQPDDRIEIVHFVGGGSGKVRFGVESL